MLTPMDIHNKEFKRGFRGYSEEDVDAFMYEKMESTMNSTLMLAQQTAENVKVSARKEADLILQEASNKKKQMMDETTLSLQASQQELDKIKSQTRSFRAKCRAILTSQLRLLDDMVIDGEDADAEQEAADTTAAAETAPQTEDVKTEE